MSSSPWEAPCKQNAKLCESCERSAFSPVPYQVTSSRQNRLRLSEGCRFRKQIMFLKKQKISLFFRYWLQSSHPVSLSWLYGLLLPNGVFKNSSPARNIGIPFDNMSRQKKFFTCLRRKDSTSADAPLSPS